MISFGNAASSHSGLIPLKTAYKKRGELLWAIASKKDFINLHSAASLLQFLHVIWSMPTIFAFFKKPLDKFFCLLSSVRCICACASYTDHRLKLTWLEKGTNMFATIRVTFNFGSIMMKGKRRENVQVILHLYITLQ